METKTELVLPIIDASEDDWEEKSNWEQAARAALDARSNFVVVFNPIGGGLQQLMTLLDCAPSVRPERLSRWGVHGLIEALKDENYRWLMSVCEARDVRMIEQLNLSSNRPPRSRPYLVYCEIHGVVSDEDTLEAARKEYAEYLNQHPRARLLPLSGVYHWEDEEWRLVGENAEREDTEIKANFNSAANP